ncbi:MAG TPA: acyl-CoA dehydrogenase family protein [Aliidongia sp.]|nr:acyl-CoA dehydrogenase family protein [Aliidongia sp.]
MIDFRISEADQHILDQVAAEGRAGEKYARHFEEHEHEPLPEAFPEAAEFEPLPRLLARRSKEDTPPATFQMLLSFARQSTNGVPLRNALRGGGGLGNAALRAAGTKEQIEKWGGLILAMSITEPGAGSDTKAIQSTARLDGEEWVLNGDKIFVTTGIRAQGVVVWATVDKSAGRAGIKSFLVMKGTQGFEIVRQEKKLGIRTSDTAAYAFRDCRVPRENLLGLDESVPREKGSASYRGVMKTFNMTRPGVASGGVAKALGAVGFARDALAEDGIKVDWQAGFHQRSATQQALIEMEADAEAASLTVLHAAWLADMGRPNNVESSVCKAKGGEVCRTVPQRAMELLGAMSVSHDHLVEKYLRDGRISDIYEGTGQIQRLIIARSILGYSSEELS